MRMSPSLRRRCLSLAIALLVASATGAARPAGANADIMFPDGVWSFGYMTSGGSCSGDYGVDPTTIITFQYGEFSRMYSHLENETDFGNATTDGSAQYICASDCSGCGVTPRPFWNEQTGHGNLGTRAHFRMWYAPHGHDSIVDKWSVLTPHHESCCAHDIDEAWETWEDHVASEMSGAHTIYWDHWYRYPVGAWRGFYQDGYVTRIGGLHNGGY